MSRRVHAAQKRGINRNKATFGTGDMSSDPKAVADCKWPEEAISNTPEKELSVCCLLRSRFPRRQEAAWKAGLEAVVENMHLLNDRACIPGLREAGTRRSLGDCCLEDVRAEPRRTGGVGVLR